MMLAAPGEVKTPCKITLEKSENWNFSFLSFRSFFFLTRQIETEKIFRIFYLRNKTNRVIIGGKYLFLINETLLFPPLNIKAKRFLLSPLSMIFLSIPLFL